MSNLAVQEVIGTKPSLNVLGADLSTIGLPTNPIDAIYSLEGEVDSLTVTTINGAAYPPPVSGNFDDATFAVVDAVDPTVRINFDAAGAAGTTGTFRFTQTANRIYTFPEVGANANVILSQGAQTVNGVKTFNSNINVTTVNGAAYPPPTTFAIDNAFTVRDNVDPTIRIAFDAAGAAGTTGTIQFTQAANRTYTFADAGANANIVLSEGAQTVNGVKTFGNNINVTTVNGAAYPPPAPSAIDNVFFIQDNVDPSIRIAFDAAGAAGTTTTFQATQVANRTVTFPDVGANADVLLSQGAQTANGLKTFNNGIASDTISETTANAGVTVDNVRIRSEAIVAPAINFTRVEALTANSYLGLLPSGIGALVADVPDNAVAGGNARGTRAVDFQRNRTAATHVASGLESFLGAGQQNTVSATRSTVVAGLGNNTVNSTNGAIVAGENNTLGGGLRSFIGAGTTNTTSGQDAAVVAGNNNTASGIRSFVGAGISNVASATGTAVVGGSGNAISVALSFIGAGSGNTVSSGSSGVGAGTGNVILTVATNSFIGAGNTNTINTVGTSCGILSGTLNVISSDLASIGGGSSNTITNSGTQGFIGGGRLNLVGAIRGGVCAGDGNSVGVLGGNGFIGAGFNNQVNDANAVVCGGNSNIANALNSFVGGGQNNIANAAASHSTIIGGQNCVTNGNHAIAGGLNATATGAQSVAFNGVATLANSLVINASTVVFGPNDTGGGTSLGNFANDAAAAVGGVPIGGLYRNVNIIQVRIV